MPSIDTSAYKYTGGLLAVDILSGDQTVLLSALAPGSVAGSLADNNGTLQPSDTGKSTFQGNPITYIGSGSVTPGVEVLGAIVPLGSPVDVVVFEMGGDIYFLYPAGEPNLLGAVALVLEVSKADYDLFPNPYVGTSSADAFFGDHFGNTMTGSDGNDVIEGRGGFDHIVGGAGEDSLNGGSANDTLEGGVGKDYLHGASGSDSLDGGDDNDTIYGGNGFDEIQGSDGLDWIDGGLGNDTIEGGLGSDIIFGNAGSDSISGGDGADEIAGQGGNDLLDGGDGDDAINGGWGNDLLNGNAGDDEQTGNRGADIFVFNNAFGNEVVTDFLVGIDRLDFSTNAQIDSFEEFVTASTQQGADLLVETGDGTLLLKNISITALDSGDFIFG